jgi:TonB family protein
MKPHEVLSEAPGAQESREGRGWVEAMILRLVRGAARQAPASLCERLEEEWLADLAARGGSAARLRFALGCWRATRVIALELGAPVGTAAAAGGKNAALFAEAPPFLPRRTVAVVLIGALHTLVIIGLAAGIGHTILKPAEQRAQASVLPNEVRQSASPPAFGGPTFVRVVPRVPDVPLIPRTGGEPAAAAAAATAAGPPAVAATPKVTRVTGGLAQGFPNTDFYPATSVRLDERGVATVHVCVNESGRLTAEPTIAQSSGSPRLDAGALRLARAGSGHYQPTTEDGRPVSSCYSFAVRFQLQY